MEIKPHVTYKKLMLQGYFLARDNFHICDKFAHCSGENDEVYLRDCISRLERDEMAVMFLETCSLEAGQKLGHTLESSHPQHLVQAYHSPSNHVFPCIQCHHSLRDHSNHRTESKIKLGSWDPSSHSTQLVKEQILIHIT